MHHAQAALSLLRAELHLNRKGLVAGLQAPPPVSRMLVYAVALHNLAVEQEHLLLFGDALRSYRGALETALEHVPDQAHPLTARLHEAAHQARTRIVHKTAPPPPTPPPKVPPRRAANPHRTQDALLQHVDRHAWVRAAHYTKPLAVPHSPRVRPQPQEGTAAARPASARADSRTPMPQPATMVRPTPPPPRPASSGYATPRRRRSPSRPKRTTPRLQKPPAVSYSLGDESTLGKLSAAPGQDSACAGDLAPAQPVLPPGKDDVANAPVPQDLDSLRPDALLVPETGQ